MPRPARWVKSHAVALTGLALVAGQLGWTAALLDRSYFRQSDFLMLDRALHEGFGWNYLMSVDSGHLMPVGLSLAWALAHISLYNWTLASVVIMILVAAASLAMLRMLLTVFVRRDGTAQPGILLLFAVYLFGPLSAGAVGWLSVALRVLPLQIAMLMAVHAHVRYLRRGKSWQLIAAAFWLAVGMASADQGALVPLLLYALTIAYFEPGRLRDAARRAFVRHRRAWALYGALLAAYCIVFFIRLAGSGVPVHGPGTAASLYRFAGTLIGTTAVPGFLGGPWQWFAFGYAQAAPPAALEYLSWVVAAVVVLASCRLRARAWRAWVILLGWIVAACIVPVAIDGLGSSAVTLGEQAGYVANATGVLALCLGLAFLPVRETEALETVAASQQGDAGQPGEASQTGKAARGALRPAHVIALLAFCCFAASTVTSLQAFQSANPGKAGRSYIATARLALASAPPGTLIVDGPTPATVMNPGFFPGQADTASVIGPLLRGTSAARRVSWISALPAGVHPNAMAFDTAGQLRPVGVTGVWSWPPPQSPTKGASACWKVTDAVTTIPLTSTLYRWPWTVRVPYSGPAGWLFVSLKQGQGLQVAVPSGKHVVYVPLTGSGNVVNVQFFANTGAASPPPLCVSAITVGLLNPDQGAGAIPARPISG